MKLFFSLLVFVCLLASPVFSAEDNQKAWVVKALEQNVYNDLSGYARVVPFKKVPDEDQVCERFQINPL